MARGARRGARRGGGPGRPCGRSSAARAGTVGLGSSQVLHLGEAGALQPRVRSPRRSRSSTAAVQSAKCGANGGSCATASEIRRNASMLPRPPHCATSRPPGPQRPVDARRTARRGRAPSGRWRSRTRRRPARADRARPGPGRGSSPGPPSALARVRGHRRRDVDAVDPPVRDPLGEQRGDLARCRSRRRAPPRRRAARAARAARRAHACCGRRDPVVGRRVPVAAARAHLTAPS